MNDFFVRIKTQYEQNLPFVVYNKPNNKNVIGIFQENDYLYFAKDFTEVGFVMAPFDNEESTVLLPEKYSEVIITEFKKNKIEIIAVPVGEELPPEVKTAYEALVRKGIQEIEAGFFNKVVLSRKEIVMLPHFNLLQLVERLLNTHVAAFAYCWFHPKVGLWMGATPEQLLEAKKNKFKTVALAGTKKYIDTEEVVWENKEKEEQQFVTDFILNNIKIFTTEITISNTHTTRVGELLHLKTNIQGILNPYFSLKQVLEVLHPTPAVCGLPKLLAKDFILSNEGYDRTFYTGFIGELNKNFVLNKQYTDLYVNLRCMSIKGNQATLFAGGGINKGSIPEKEWMETVNKTMTMKGIID